MRRARQTRPRTLVRTVTAALALVLVAPLAGSSTATADEPAPQARKLASQRQVALATPGDFTGYGFDQCVAPTQSAMDAWWKKSPFTAVGIYISGDSRACRTQPNLSSTWVAAQVARGWRLLPIALGPQASCQPRFPRYKDDFKISPSPTGGYATAAAQGATEADKNAADAATYGIGAGSTIWYDLEGFNLQRHPLPRVRPGLHVRVGHPDQGARLHRRLLLQRELGHQDARRRPHPAPRPVRPAGPHLDRPLGRRGQHLHDLHPRGRLAPRRPDEAVPRRPQRDVGRRHDQHRQQLHRPRRRLPAASGGPLPRHPARLLEVPRALAVVREVHARQGAAVPAHRAGHLLRSGQRLVRRRHDRRRPRLAVRPQVHAEQHLREAALDRAARRRCPYDGQARVGRRVGAPAPAGAQRGRRRALPGDRCVRREDRGGRPDLPVTPEDRRLGRRHAARPGTSCSRVADPGPASAVRRAGRRRARRPSGRPRRPGRRAHPGPGGGPASR